jgi:hypothetical protein
MNCEGSSATVHLLRRNPSGGCGKKQKPAGEYDCHPLSRVRGASDQKKGISMKTRFSCTSPERNKLKFKRESKIFISALLRPEPFWLNTAKSTRVRGEADVVMTSAIGGSAPTEKKSGQPPLDFEIEVRLG